MSVLTLNAILHCGQQLTLTVSGFPSEAVGILTVTTEELSRQVSVIQQPEVTLTLPVAGIQDLVLGYQGKVGTSLVTAYEHLHLPVRCPEEPVGTVQPFQFTLTNRQILIRWH
jgi:hypothetical protein